VILTGYLLFVKHKAAIVRTLPFQIKGNHAFSPESGTYNNGTGYEGFSVVAFFERFARHINTPVTSIACYSENIWILITDRRGISGLIPASGRSM